MKEGERTVYSHRGNHNKGTRYARERLLCRVIKLWLEKELEPDSRGPRMPYTDLLPTGSEVIQSFCFFKQ